MKRLYYITRSFAPDNSGGAIVRTHTVNLLRQFFDVHVITCQDGPKEIGIERIPVHYNIRIAGYLERLGILQDYLYPWVQKVFKLFCNHINNDDIVFCTSGGELGTIILGCLLKQHTNCKLVINHRDPITYTLVNGLKIDNKFHVNRDSLEEKYLSFADLIVTSSLSNLNSLLDKYPHFKDKLCNNYFGFIGEYRQKNKNAQDKPAFVYGGRFGRLQAPEIFAECCRPYQNKLDLIFIGDYHSYRQIRPYIDQYKFTDSMCQEKYHEMMIDRASVGLLSLSSDYLGACVPAKLYDYIGLHLPMLGALPNGDAKNIINDNGFGIACYYKDKVSLSGAIEKMLDIRFRNCILDNISEKCSEWSMNVRIIEIVDKINTL